MQTTHYRPDIEGLRAIAILAVVVCHAKLPYMQGGFVGVDIFFVLSGYLITGLLAKEIGATGRLNFPSFYARRFKRLLPALVLMLVVSSLVAFLVFSPVEQSAQAYAGQAAFLWMSNFYFAMSNFGYFDVGSAGNIFLHTWSLGVEEQFYVVWPALMLLFMRGNVLNWLIATFAVCLAISIYLSYAHPLWAFYSMPSRGWQFALGGIVCLLPHNPKAFAGYAGLALITASILLFDEQMTYPGFAALAPSIGAALVLSARLPALSIKPLQAVGRVSYSWYLWHWPVLIIGASVFNRQDTAFQLILVAASFLLAVLAYIAVENPIRKSEFMPRRVVMASLSLMVAGIFGAHSWISNSIQWAQSDRLASFEAVRNNMPRPYTMGCDGWTLSSGLRPCIYGPQDAKNKAVLVGDSVLLQWFSAIASIHVDVGWSLTVLTKSACPMVDESIYYSEAGGMYTVCDEWRGLALDYIKELSPDVVFMGSSAAYELKDWRSASERIIAPLSKTAGKVYIIRATPALAFDGPNCLARKDWQPAFIAALSECNSPVSTSPDESVLSALHEASNGFDNVRVLDFNDLVCPDGICRAENYRDSTHITDKFVRSITPQVNAIIQAQ